MRSLRSLGTALGAVAALAVSPADSAAQRALVYCPVGVDATGCTTLVTSLAATFPDGVDRGWDGTGGTVDLASADLSAYALFVVPSLADVSGRTPYGTLRETAIAARLRNGIRGRITLWSGTPDQGTGSREQKDLLLTNLATWAAADFATAGGPGLLALQDNSALTATRYDWLSGLTGLTITADPKQASYASVRALNATGTAVVGAGTSAIAYANMASYGFYLPVGAAGLSLDAVGQTGTTTGGQVVLATALAGNRGAAVVTTDKDDYPPGTTVVMSGFGFDGGEEVKLELTEDPVVHTTRTFEVTANEDGEFTFTGFAPEDHHLDVRFILTATGQTSGRVAQTTFTDGNPQSASLSPAVVSVAPGGTATFGLTITVGGNATTCTMSFAVSGAFPAGTSANFASASATTTNANVSNTLSIVPPSGATPGDYAFTVTVGRGSNCQGNGDITTTGTLRVSGPVGPSAQFITFNALPDQLFGVAPITLSATATSGLAVTFSATGECTVSGTTLTVTGAGSCAVTASQAGDGTQWAAATPVQRTFTIDKGTATLAFDAPTLAQTYTSAPRIVTVGTDPANLGGVAVTYDGQASAPTAVGSYAVVATLTNPNYQAAQITGTLVVAKAQATITLGALSHTYDGTVKAATATTAPNGLAVDVSYTQDDAPASPVDAGSYDVLAVVTDANYEGSTTGVLVIGRATPGIEVTGGTFTYDGSPHPATGAVTGIGGVSLGEPAFSYAPGGSAPVDAGTYTATGTFAGNANYGTASASATITITRASQSIDFAALADRTYGDAAFAISASATSGLTVAFAAMGDCTVASGMVTLTGAGDCTITASQPGNGNYDAATPVIRTFSIAKAAPTVTVTGGTFTYDGQPHAATGSAKGVGGADLGPPSFEYAPGGDTPVNAGTYQVTATFAGNDDYTSATATGSLVIEKAAQTITWATPTAITYGTTLSGAQLNAVVVGVSGGSAPGALTYDPPSGALLGAGTHTLAASAAATDNYTAASATVQLVVNKAATVTVVTCEAGPFTYTGSAQTPCSAQVTGAGLSEAVTVTYQNNVDAGTATATATYAESANYLGSSDSETFTIAKAATTTAVTCTAGPHVYDGSAKAPCAATVTGPSLNQAVNVTYENNVNAGTATAKAAYAESANHLGSHDEATFTIEKANTTTTVTCPAGPHVYDGSEKTPCSARVAGPGGLDEAVTPVTHTNNVNAGTATASATYGGSANYNGSTGNASFTIAKAPTVTALTCSAGPHVFTGSAITPCSATVTGPALSQSVTPTYENNVDAGTATATATYGESANHLGSTDSETFTIDRAPTTTVVTCAAGPHVYGGSAKTPCSATVTGPALSESVDVTYQNNVNAGTATASATYAGSGNHLGSSGTETFEITKADPTISVQGFTGPFDGNPHGATGTARGVMNETLTGLNLGATYTDVPGGTATWTYTDATGNYNDATGTVAITITKAATITTVTCPAGPFVYNGSQHTPCTASVTGPGGLSQPIAPTYQNNVNAGTATANAAYPGGANHFPSNGSATFTIDKAPAAIANFTDLVKAYSGSAQKPVVITSPLNVQVTLAFSQDGQPRGSAAGVIPVGVYNVDATITDPNYYGEPAEALFVIYDASAGFVTGGGWINSPADACVNAAGIAGLCQAGSSSGKAHFGFNSKYQKGANKPTGQTEFQFQAGSLNFKSTLYDWLVVNGTTRAQFKGTGTINGGGSYQFMLTAIDGDNYGSKKPDAFRIKITDASGRVVYDNQLGAGDTGEDATILGDAGKGGGSIVIHNK